MLTAAALAVTMLGVVRLPVAWVGARLLGPDGIWLAFAVSNVVAAAVAVLWFRRDTWRDSDVTGNGPPPRPPRATTADLGVVDGFRRGAVRPDLANTLGYSVACYRTVDAGVDDPPG